jgi:hypothetical protein
MPDSNDWRSRLGLKAGACASDTFDGAMMRRRIEALKLAKFCCTTFRSEPFVDLARK